MKKTDKTKQTELWNSRNEAALLVRGLRRDTNLWEMAFLIDERQQGAGLPGQELQDVLVVTELYVPPLHVLFQVLLLLQLEDVADEELLQRLVGKVDAQLLKAALRGQSAGVTSQSCGSDLKGRRSQSQYLFVLKFSKPKISSRPMDRQSDLAPSVKRL